MTVSLIHADAGRIPLADGTVSLVVTSPPYWALRSYRDGDAHYDGQLGSEPTPHAFLANLWAVLDECWRVLRDDGSAWINLGDKFNAAGMGSRHGQGSTAAFNVPKSIEERNGQGAAGRVGQPLGHTRRPAAELRSKSRMLLPHRFALGAIDPVYRSTTEQAAGLTPTVDPPQWICRMDAVWSKPNGLPESVTDRVRASHEYWFHLTKSERYYSAVDAIREDYSATSSAEAMYRWQASLGADTSARHNDREATRSGGHDGLKSPDYRRDPLGKLPGSVWEVATEPLLLPDHLPQHFAAFPSEFPRRLVLGWSPSGVCVRCGQGRRPVVQRTGRIVSSHGGDIPTHAVDRPYERRIETQVNGVGGHHFPKHETTITGTACACPTPDAPTRPAVVLDPFSGTGTTAVVASALGRHGVGVDLSWDYHRIARWRDHDGGLRCKALGVARPEKQLEGQMSLLGEAGS